MQNRHFTSQRHAATARKLSEAIVPLSTIARDSTPVYLSRCRLSEPGQLIVGEEGLEDHLRASGFTIVHPETLSLSEQIQLVNRHDTFTGVVGSAFHSLLFRTRAESATVVYLADPNLEARQNYLQIDSVLGTQSRWIDCVRNTQEKPRRRQIDCEKALREIFHALNLPDSISSCPAASSF